MCVCVCIRPYALISYRKIPHLAPNVWHLAAPAIGHHLRGPQNGLNNTINHAHVTFWKKNIHKRSNKYIICICVQCKEEKRLIYGNDRNKKQQTTKQNWQLWVKIFFLNSKFKKIQKEDWFAVIDDYVINLLSSFEVD